MQNKYVGDIGDFGKYGLLRALCGVKEDCSGEKLSLGVVWYFNTANGGAGGQRVEYLMDSDRFRPCDPILFHSLFWMVVANRRSVKHVSESGIFPSDTDYFDDPVPRDREKREGWLDQALAQTARHKLAFLDPDNGLATTSHGGTRPSPRHVYAEEVNRFVAQGNSVVIYHQFGRKNHSEEIRDRAETLRLVGIDKLWVLLFKRISPRAFFVIPAKRDQDILLSRAEQLTRGTWSGHFSLVDPESESI